MELYSFKGQYPRALKSTILISAEDSPDNTEEVIDIANIENPEEYLYKYGYVKVESPNHNYLIEKLEWNGSEFLVKNLTKEEIQFNLLKEKTIDFSAFVSKFKDTSYYKRFKSKVYSENKSILIDLFVSLELFFRDCLLDNFVSIDDRFLYCLVHENPTADELAELKEILTETNLIYFYDEECECKIFGNGFIFKNSSGELLFSELKPHDSWIFDEKLEKWCPPIARPIDNNTYYWDQNEYDSNGNGWIKV